MANEVFIDDAGVVTDATGFDGKTETQRVQEAKAELITEQLGQPQPLILGKFTGVDALAQSYQSLESEAGRLRAELAALKATPSTPPAAPPAAAPDPAAPPATTGEGASAAPEAPPAATTPEAPAAPPAAPAAPPAASPESLISPERQQQIMAAMLAQAGGEEGFAKIAQWASTNLAKAETEAFNAALLKGDEATVMRQLKAIQFDMLMTQGYEPQLIGGKTVPAATITPFKTEAEVNAAMLDPRYSGGGADPAYIAEVEARLAASPDLFAGR